MKNVSWDTSAMSHNTHVQPPDAVAKQETQKGKAKPKGREGGRDRPVSPRVNPALAGHYRLDLALKSDRLVK